MRCSLFKQPQELNRFPPYNFYIFLFPTPFFNRVICSQEKKRMNQRLSLFFAGYCAYNPALYYGQKSLVDEFSSSEDEILRGQINLLSQSLADAHFEPESNIATAISIAEKLEIKTLKKPVDPSTYFDWRENYTEQFESQFPMSRIDHYYFLYSRKIAEVFSNIGLAEKLLGIKYFLSGECPADRKIDKYLKDSEYILFKLIAAAALLSSEPRHSCFNQHYRQLSQGYQQFKDITAGTLDREEIPALCNRLLNYQRDVEKAVKECVVVLKDLDI
jgi:hypothetical protein